MIEYYNYIKALHLIFVITWFAGLFYIPRLFIYQIEAQDKSDFERKILSVQLKIMSKRLWYIITWPSAILAIFFGLSLLNFAPYLLDQPWMHAKLLFVFILIAYHIKTHFIFKMFQKYNVDNLQGLIVNYLTASTCSYFFIKEDISVDEWKSILFQIIK